MGAALSHRAADGRKMKTLGMAFLSLGLFGLTCQFKLSFPLSSATKVQGSWGWSFSVAPPVEAELWYQEESKTWEEKHHEESSSVTCSPLIVPHSQFCFLLQGLFLYFILRSQRGRKRLGSGWFALLLSLAM